MGLPKGRTNNPAGKPIGSNSKPVGDLRRWVHEFIDGQREQILQDWQSLEPRERIQMFEKLMRFVLPTLQATTLKTDFDRMTDSELDYIISELKQVSN